MCPIRHPSYRTARWRQRQRRWVWVRRWRCWSGKARDTSDWSRPPAAGCRAPPTPPTTTTHLQTQHTQLSHTQMYTNGNTHRVEISLASVGKLTLRQTQLNRYRITFTVNYDGLFADTGVFSLENKCGTVVRFGYQMGLKHWINLSLVFSMNWIKSP